MRDINDLPHYRFGLQAVTCAEMDEWCKLGGYGMRARWASAKHRRSTAGALLMGNPFIVVDLPPDPTTRKVFTPADPTSVWF